MPVVHLARKNSQSSNEYLLFQFDILYSLETKGMYYLFKRITFTHGVMVAVWWG